MKNILVFILELLFVGSSYSQFSEIHLGVYHQLRYDKMEVLNPNTHIVDGLIDDQSDLVLIAGFTYNERFIFSFEYSHEFFIAGFKFYNTRSEYGGATISVDKSHSFSLLGAYSLFHSNSKFNIEPYFGIKYAHSGYYDGAFDHNGNWFQPNTDGTWTIVECHSEWKKDYGNNKYYLFALFHLKLTYRPFEFLTMFLKGGYNHGFSDIGNYNGWIQIADEPKIPINNESKGTYYFLSVGAQLNFVLNNNNN